MLRKGLGESKPHGGVSTSSEQLISPGKADEMAATACPMRASRWPLFEPIFMCISIVFKIVSGGLYSPGANSARQGLKALLNLDFLVGLDEVAFLDVVVTGD